MSAEEILLSRSEPADGSLPQGPANFFEGQLADVLVRAGLVPSKNVARQKVKEGAVSISDDGQVWRKIESPAEPLRLGEGQAVFLRMGKKFVRVKP